MEIVQYEFVFVLRFSAITYWIANSQVQWFMPNYSHFEFNIRCHLTVFIRLKRDLKDFTEMGLGYANSKGHHWKYWTINLLVFYSVVLNNSHFNKHLRHCAWDFPSPLFSWGIFITRINSNFNPLTTKSDRWSRLWWSVKPQSQCRGVGSVGRGGLVLYVDMTD